MSTNSFGSRVGWFADTSADHPNMWQPVIETHIGCHTIDTWFNTEAECQQFIHDQLTGQVCVDTCHPPTKLMISRRTEPETLRNIAADLTRLNDETINVIVGTLRIRLLGAATTLVSIATRLDNQDTE